MEGKKVKVMPPWRSDGRCGPQFPVGHAPGECDPYGGVIHVLLMFFLEVFQSNEHVLKCFKEKCG